MAIYITITNPSLEEFEETALSKKASTNDTVLNVLSGIGFKKNDILLVGEYGEENAEVVYISSTVDPTDTTITLTAGLKFPHSENTPITYMPFDKFRIYQSNDNGQTWFVADTISIRPDDNETVYIAAGSSASLFKIASYNSITAIEGEQSDAISGSGLGFSQVGSILDRVYDLYQDPQQKFLTSDDIVLNYLNEGYLDMFGRMAALGQGYATKISDDITLEANKSVYDWLSDFSKLIKLEIDYANSGNYYSARKIDLLMDDENYFTESAPGYLSMHSQFKIYPTPNKTGKMRLVYVFNATPLTSMTDKVNLPIPDFASKILVDFCIARIYEKAYQPDKASYFLQAFENGVSAWLTSIAERQRDLPQFVRAFGEDWESPIEKGSGIVY